MAILPFADWFYHLTKKDDQLNSKYNEYLTLVENINASGFKFNHDLETLQKMLVINYGLIVISAQTQLSESEFSDFLSHNEQLPPAKPSTPTVITVLDATAGLLGIASIGNFVWNLGKAYGPGFKEAVNSLFKSGGEGAGEAGSQTVTEMVSLEGTERATQAGLTAVGEQEVDSIANAATNAGVEAGTQTGIDAAEVAIDEASSASLGSAAAASGAGLVAAIGIDAILGAIDGAQQRKKLDEAIDNLNKALLVMTHFSVTLESHFTSLQDQVVAQEEAFLATMTVLNNIEPATFSYGSASPSFENRVNFLVEMQQALAQYGYLTKIRAGWITYQGNSSDNASWDDYVSIALAFKPIDMTETVAQNFINYAKNKLI